MHVCCHNSIICVTKYSCTQLHHHWHHQCHHQQHMYQYWIYIYIYIYIYLKNEYLILLPQCGDDCRDVKKRKENIAKLTWTCKCLFTYVILDHKTSHKGTFFKIEIYISSESWINKRSIDVWFIRIGQYLSDTTIWKSRIWGCKNNSKYWENLL